MENLEIKEADTQHMTADDETDEKVIIAPERLIFRDEKRENENSFDEALNDDLIRSERLSVGKNDAEGFDELLSEGNTDSERASFSKSGEKPSRDERDTFTHPERLALRKKGEERRLAIEAEFRKINALDPSVKSFDDLILMENAEEFAEKVRKGYSLSDAFIITNGKKLSEKLKNQAVKATLSRLGTKQHLVSTSSAGTDSAFDVPAETYSLYKNLYPNITDKEIRKHYKKHNK